MEQNKVDIFVATMNEKFAPANMVAIRTQLEKIDDSKLGLLQSLNYKNPILVLVLSLLFGGLGVDRFMLGQTGLGIVKLLTCGGMGIWSIIDWFLVMGKAKEINFKLFMDNAQ